jgi:opacity protein-like surface antigen
MKRLLLVAIAVVAAFAARPATSADLPMAPVYQPPPPIVPVYSWTGCYLGGTVGTDGRRGTIQILVTIYRSRVFEGTSWQTTLLPAVRSAATIKPESLYLAFRGWAIGPR